MNPDRIYSQYRDDALAKQATASEYSTFVAMPFADRFSFRSKSIYTEIIQAAATKANELKQTPRQFAKPTRVDDGAGTAAVITESILTDILHAHLFIGDLTFENPGVVLEVGIALGLKPNAQLILVMQGEHRELHFDIRNNNVITYNSPDAIARIATAMVAGALSFEADVGRFIESIKRTLTPDAVALLNRYGSFQKANPEQSLHLGVANIIFQNHPRSEGRFEDATRELLAKRLIYTEYKVKAVEAGDVFGMHATDLGWVVISRMWPELAKVAVKI